MDLTKVVQESEFSWRIPVSGKMRVPGILYGNRRLIEQMDEKVYEQLSHVAHYRGSSVPPTPCRTHIGDTVFQSEALPPLIRSKEA